MGLFDRWRTPAEAPWEAPALGACGCEEHVENLRAHPAGGSATTVGALLDGGDLGCEQVGAEPSYAVLPHTGQRIGPFHWRLTLGPGARALYDAAAPAALDDCLSLQPGIDRVLWPDHGDLLVGAPTLCPSGVTAALVRTLDNPRLRPEN
ncbi:MAG: hypothetical protein ACTHKG_02385 [Nocardioides sp.]